MRAIGSTETNEERNTRLARAMDEALQRKERTIREAREMGRGVVYLVWDDADVWHPHIEAAFDNRPDAETWASLNADWSWSPMPVHKSVESAMRWADEV